MLCFIDDFSAATEGGHGDAGGEQEEIRYIVLQRASDRGDDEQRNRNSHPRIPREGKIETQVWAENLNKESQAFISANIKEKMTKAQEWAEKWAVDFYGEFVQQGEAANKEQRTEALDMWVNLNLQNVASFYNAMDAFLDEKQAKMHKNALLLGKAALSAMFSADLEGEEALSQAQEECLPMNIDEIVAILKED